MVVDGHHTVVILDLDHSCQQQEQPEVRFYKEHKIQLKTHFYNLPVSKDLKNGNKC